MERRKKVFPVAKRALIGSGGEPNPDLREGLEISSRKALGMWTIEGGVLEALRRSPRRNLEFEEEGTKLRLPGDLGVILKCRSINP